MGDFFIRLNRNAKHHLDLFKKDVEIKWNVRISNGQAVELLLNSPKIVILPPRKKDKKLKINYFI